MEVAGGGRRRRLLSDENSDNPNLRDFLRVKQDSDSSQTSTSVTLGAVLTETRPAAQPIPTRTLFDIIRDDPTSHQGNRKTWKIFRDKLRLRRAGAAWTSSIRIPASDVPIPSANPMILRRQSTRFPTAPIDSDPNPESNQQSHSTHDSMDPLESTQMGPEISRSGLSSLPSNRTMMMRHNSSRIPSLSAPYRREPERLQTFNSARSIVRMADQNIEQQQQLQLEEENEGDERESEEGEEGESEEEPQVRMSLMDLLADGSPFIMGDDDDEEEEEEEVSSGVAESNCCVCMVRHKGAAFIPCGHTFCRMCSRELWVQRGSCPLCNNFILEILDIF